jgi:hypothetical protein
MQLLVVLCLLVASLFPPASGEPYSAAADAASSSSLFYDLFVALALTALFFAVVFFCTPATHNQRNSLAVGYAFLAGLAGVALFGLVSVSYVILKHAL